MNEKKEVAKPITLVREDFIKSLVSLCNNSGLPLFTIKDILKDLLQDVDIASNKQLEADRAKYKEELSKLESQQEDKKDGE